ncbi:immunoglobulin domain-containing protein [Luteolibacter luteus]|uniref:Fibronectin type-III domain-containing protein n=1 Tax=Luteolibacter luteus TaxID=2728835 RepID=A0A858RKG6_9BACT|nr:fibronectin type III domain-containing protein [Luteolibacter luteus]QJE97081.1 hypothetical protein HHL09_15225 [Luteolibacter luteus]
MPLLRLALAILSLSDPVLGAISPGSASVAWDRNSEENISGYKIYWGESTRQYTRVLDVGNALEAVLTSLTSGQTYFCAVTAYNTAGQESLFSAEVSLTYVAEPGAQDTSTRMILVEAESGQMTSPFAKTTESGTTYVSCPVYPIAGSISVNFNVPTDDEYQVWCRVRGGTSSSDSIYIAMDGTTDEEIFHFYGAPDPLIGVRSGNWMWKKIFIPPPASPAPTGATVLSPRVYSLTTGGHSLRFRAREQHAQIDRIVLTSDPNFVPNDTLARSGDVLTVTGNPVSQIRNAGQAAAFTVSAVATGPVSYQWKKNGVALSGANSATLILTNLDPADSGTYSVDLSRGSTAASAGPASLVVNGAALPEIFKVSRVIVNPDHTLSFHIEGEPDTNILVYASSDMITWSLIAVEPNESGQISVSDPGSGGKTKRFYRLVSESTAPL